MALRAAAGTAVRGVGSLRQHSLVATRAVEVFLPRISAACSPSPSGFRLLCTKSSDTLLRESFRQAVLQSLRAALTKCNTDDGSQLKLSIIKEGIASGGYQSLKQFNVCVDCQDVDPRLRLMIQDAVQEGLKSDALKLMVQAAVDEGLKSDALTHTIELAVQKALKFDVEGPMKAQAMGVYSASSSADLHPKSDAAHSPSGSRPAGPLPKSTGAYCPSGSRVSRSPDLLIKSSAAYCPWGSRVSRSLVLLPKNSAGYLSYVSKSCLLPLSGARFFSTQKGCADLDKFEKFEKLYQKDRVHVSTGLDLIVVRLSELKEEVNQADFIQKWLTNIGKETLLLSDSQIEGFGKGWTCLGYGCGFFAWGTLVYFGVITIRENDIPYTDYFHLLNCVRVQALNRGIAQYKAEKQERQEAVEAKALNAAAAMNAAAAKKAAEDAAAEKKAKDVEAAASRKAKAEQTGAKWKSKSKQAAALRKAKAREVRHANLTKWKQANAERKEADTARKMKAALALAQIKAKEKEAAAKRKSKAEELAAAVAAARKAKAAKKSGPKK